MNYVHLFLSNKWCNLLNITVLVIMHRIFIYNKDNKHLSYENLLMTRSHPSCMVTTHLILLFKSATCQIYMDIFSEKIKHFYIY